MYPPIPDTAAHASDTRAILQFSVLLDYL